MEITKLVLNILITASGLLCAGGLGEMVLDLQKKAAHDTAVGIVSIGAWNHRLTNSNGDLSPTHSKSRHESTKPKKSNVHLGHKPTSKEEKNE